MIYFYLKTLKKMSIYNYYSKMSKSFYLSASENQKSFSHIRLNKIKKKA